MNSYTVSVLPGGAEGRWHAQDLYRTLEQRDYTLVSDARVADIIIAHSGGCYMVPKQNVASCILLIGPPYWPGKSFYISLVQKVSRDVKSLWKLGEHTYLLRKVGTSGFYLITRPFHWGRMQRSWRRLDLPKVLPNQHVLLVRNQHDSFCDPHQLFQLVRHKGYGLLSLPGEHDDCWIAPARYVDIINSVIHRERR